jgi:hypothetical protein
MSNNELAFLQNFKVDNWLPSPFHVSIIVPLRVWLQRSPKIIPANTACAFGKRSERALVLSLCHAAPAACAEQTRAKSDVARLSHLFSEPILTLRLVCPFRRPPAGRRAGQDAARAQQGAREHPETTADPGGRPDPGNRGEREKFVFLFCVAPLLNCCVGAATRRRR